MRTPRHSGGVEDESWRIEAPTWECIGCELARSRANCSCQSAIERCSSRCFLDMILEYFKQVLCKLQEEIWHTVIDLYTCFDEMQGLYDKFTKHCETIEDHHHRMRAASTTLVKVTGWENHSKERSDGLRILDKLEVKQLKLPLRHGRVSAIQLKV